MSTKDEKEAQPHPTEVLKAEIQRFTQDVEALWRTLPLLMAVTGYSKEQAKEELNNYLNKYGEKKEERSIITYSLPVDHAFPSQRLERKYLNLRAVFRLIPRNFVISLVSQYDSFLGHIIRFIFAVKPDKLNASEKSIPYTDLIRFPNLDAAREYIIEKEVETVIRRSHIEQFTWLKEKLGTPFNKDLESWPVFIELTERRNLFVHCDGRISSQYLRICCDHKCSLPDNHRLNDQLEVPNKYFESAYKCIYEIGFKMAHIIWRRLCPDRLESSDDNIINTAYHLIEDGQYELAIRILDFFTQPNIKHHDETCRRFILLNRAQAYKWFGKVKECEEIVASEDWSASEDKLKIAVAVLRDDFKGCFNLMRKLRHDTEYHRSYYKEWPIFQKLRQQTEFLKVYEECYGEPFLLEQTAESDESNKSGEQLPAPDLPK